MAARSCQSSSCKRTRVLRHLYFTSGRHYWEVLVERVADAQEVVVGVADAQEVVVGVAEEVESEQAVGYAATGVILQSGLEVCRARAYAVGDTVGVYLDMNTQRVAFFLNDEAQVDPTLEGSDNMVHFGGNHEDSGSELELEMKPPPECAGESRMTWYSFRARAMFAALGVSSNADSFVVVRAELPDGYR